MIANSVWNVNIAAALVQIDGSGARIVQFHPRVGKLVEVVHDAVHVRLHQLVQNHLGTTSRRDRKQNEGKEQ